MPRTGPREHDTSATAEGQAEPRAMKGYNPATAEEGRAYICSSKFRKQKMVDDPRLLVAGGREQKLTGRLAGAEAGAGAGLHGEKQEEG